MDSFASVSFARGDTEPNQFGISDCSESTWKKIAKENLSETSSFRGVAKRLGLSPGNVRVIGHRTAGKFRQFIAAKPELANAFGLNSPLHNAAAEISEPQPPDRFADLSKISPDHL